LTVKAEAKIARVNKRKRKALRAGLFMSDLKPACRQTGSDPQRQSNTAAR